MSTKVKHYLEHIEEYDKLSEEQQNDCLDGCWGELMDNLWYGMTDEERNTIEEVIATSTCNKYGHDEAKEDCLEYACSCGSRKPYKIEP